jgi:hypothetical protein
MKLLFFLILINVTKAEIIPPNYGFTLSEVEFFFPSKSFQDAKKKFPNSPTQVLVDSGVNKLYFMRIKNSRYHLDIYTQVKEDTIVDTYIRMPQHFYHDQLLSDLQTKWKKQDNFYKKNQTAHYNWYNRDAMNILYEGSCTITCFPMFIEFASNDKNLVPLYKKFNESLLLSK